MLNGSSIRWSFEDIQCCYKHLEIFFLQNLDFFRDFWHKSLIMVLLPKIPQKVQILENKKKIIILEFKNTTFLFGQRRP